MDKQKTPFEEKIHQLFADRLIDWQFEHSSLSEDKDFYRSLQGVQAAIYALDAYLEQNRELEAEVLAELWAGIHTALEDLGLSHREREELLAEVRAYEEQEVGTHMAQPMPLAPLATFYYYKTCDVRLHRRLIQRFDRYPDDLPPLTAWLPFDLITEIEDDLLDIREDEDTYNVNRFLFAMRQQTPEQTAREYLDYIDRVLADRLLADTYPHAEVIRRITEEAAGRVKSLLHQQLVVQA